MSSQSAEGEITTIQPPTSVEAGAGAPPPPPSTVDVEEKKSADEDASPVVIEEQVGEDGEDNEDPRAARFGTALLTGGRKSGPLLAKLSSWGKQANFSNAKDLFAKARFPKAVSSTSVSGSNSSSTPVGGLLGTALESAQLEEASPTAATTPNATNTETEEAAASAAPPPPPPNSPPRSGSNGPNDSLLDDASSDSAASSSYYSSVYTESLEGGSSTNFKGTFRWAAASVVDSVQTYRGRYAISGSSTPSGISSPLPLVTSLSTTSVASQTQRILQSRAKDHVAHLLESLAGPHEYIMLLGNGLLGVNLKATYLQNRGVYVDYLVPGGAAAVSQIIRPGDLLLRVGDTDVQRSSIYKVPQQIAAAARPVHLVLATGGLPKNLWQVDHVDVAVALLHQFQQQQQVKEEDALEQQQNSPQSKDECATPSRSNVRFAMHSQPDSPGRLTSDEEDDILHTQQEDEDKVDHDHDYGDDDDDSRGAVVAQDSGQGDQADALDNTGDETDAGTATEQEGVSLVHPTSFDSCDTPTPKQVQSSTAWTEVDVPPFSQLWQKNYNKDWFELPPPSQALREQCRTDSARRCSDLKVTASDLLAQGVEGPTLDRALQYALLEVVTDYRKRSFWERHIKLLAAADPDHPPPEALLVLFVELWDFGQYFTFMDDHQRSTTFHRMAHTYFVPTVDDQVGLVPPLIDFHTLVGDTTLRAIEAVLKHQQPLTRYVWRDCFEAALAALAKGAFLDFVKSDECARMRGHLRHTAPFWNVPLPTVVELLCRSPSSDKTDSVATLRAQNYVIYLLTYLLCQTDNEGVGELIDLDNEGPRTRIEGAASGFCAALFIKGPWLSVIRSGNTEAILSKYNQLWDIHLSPSVGSLAMTSLSAMASTTLTSVIEKLEEIRSQQEAAEETDVCSLLVDDGIVNRIHQLATDLLYDYARNAHPRFTVHKFHEWMGQEAVKLLSDDSLETFEALPRLPPGSIKRFLRRVEFPPGVSSHKPIRENAEANSNLPCGAECAVVFGNSVGLDMMGSMDNDEDTRRYACQSLFTGDKESDNALQPENIPPTLEAYASLPLSKKHPMSNYVNQQWISQDGWDIGLVNFVLPRTDVNGSEGGDRSLYGVSLIFQRAMDEQESKNETGSTKFDIPTQLCSRKPTEESPISFEADGTVVSPLRKIAVEDCDVSGFNTYLRERTWRERITKEVRPGRTVARVGIALVSQRNAILSMRDVLTTLLQDFSRLPHNDTSDKMICGPLVDILGNFAYQDVDASVVGSLLRPYLQFSSKKWVDRPIASQREDFENIAGEQMANSLPPIAIAMMFVTALLEQKIVITSSRRSLLLSTTTALKHMLQPLKWCHLLVPRVPANLIADLLQYPAPFVLGLPSDEPGVMELIRNLPEEITLVDLDVGRVILAPTFAHANELSRVSSTDSDTSAALRTQVLYLAQSLGSVFGASIDEPLWSCDRPFAHAAIKDNTKSSRFHRLLNACHDFIEELLAGTTSCCYWIEESTIPSSEGQARSDPTVFFDEDHFFHLKNKRSQDLYQPLLRRNSFSRHLSLALEDFDLFFELFLRSQSMSTYIGGLDSSLMVYSTR